jgi:hypothetical protein
MICYFFHPYDASEVRLSTCRGFFTNPLRIEECYRDRDDSGPTNAKYVLLKTEDLQNTTDECLEVGFSEVIS